MTLKEYQQEAVKFRTPESDNAEYLHLGLIAEVGEVAEANEGEAQNG